jgi:hypothetical protein
MSLDIYFKGETIKRECECHCGHCHEVEETETLFDANITHNLGRMASEAGIYEALWRPHRLKPGYDIPEDNYNEERVFENNNVTLAKEILAILEKGLKDLKEKPEHFKQFDASNGWGTYEHFVPFVAQVLQACKDYPEAKVFVSR